MISLVESILNLTEYLEWMDEGRKMTADEKDARWGPVVGVHDSSSQPGEKYEVRRRNKDQYSCQCKGWVFHRKCKHCEAEAARHGEVHAPYDYNVPVDATGAKKHGAPAAAPAPKPAAQRKAPKPAARPAAAAYGNDDDWFKSLSKEQQDHYLKMHPNSKIKAA